MATQRARDRCRERLESLGRSHRLGADGESLQREAIAELRRVIGFDRWCWPLGDPETLLPGMGMADHDYGPALPRALELEYSGTDFAAKDVIARRAPLAGSLHNETGGDLARSPRWDEVLRPVGIGDVAAVACRDTAGCWGWIEVYRDAEDHGFAEEDLELLAQSAPTMGGVLRRSVAGAVGAGEPDVAPEAAGVLVLDRELGLVSQTPSAAAWISRLPAAALFEAWGMLPAPVYPAATLARGGDVARAHVVLPSSDGRWVRIEAAPLAGRRDGEIVVTIREPSRVESLDLLGRAHGLTRRERQVVALLVEGLSTRELARRLVISGYTVQDHLKSVFGKLGVHSRRELVARVNRAGWPADRQHPMVQGP